MRWWVHPRELTLVTEQLREMRAERDYWREKAELLLDSTLFRRGDVSEHVFRKAPAAEHVSDPIADIFRAMGKREITSAAQPMTQDR